MRKLLLLPLFLLLLVACSSAAVTEEDTSAPSNPGSAETAVPEAPEKEGADVSSTNPVETGTTPEKAGVVRERDHSLGTSDPVVTIIEYGDFQ